MTNTEQKRSPLQLLRTNVRVLPGGAAPRGRRKSRLRSGLLASRSARSFAVLASLVAFGCATEPGAEDKLPARVTEWSCADGALSDAPMRRLTRFEYSNIISDVFALNLDFDSILPRDEVALGFDNQAGALSVTDLHVEGFLKAAERVSQAVVDEPERLAAISGCDENTQACAQRTAREVGQLLLRRPLASSEVSRLTALFDDDYSEGGYREGTTRMVSALLQAPEFLYRVERRPSLADSATQDAKDQAEIGLPPAVLASRLSFLFWGSSPDAVLLDAVDQGELRTPEDVARWARAMLADDRAKRGVLHFFEQWLGLSDYDEVEKDRRLFPAWGEQVHADLARETRRFLEALLWQDDARFSTLLTARYTYLTPVLMDFYGVPVTSTDSSRLERVEFDNQQPRLGILTQGSLMSRLAKANQTDPIHRGKFIRERFLCSIPPPPPPNLVVSAPELDPRKTTRERFEQHRADAACATCHELLDPVGLAFEHYDAVGRYRSSEAGEEIDASGELIDTDVDGPIDGVADLADKLSHSAQVRECVVKQAFRYAFGRAETERDSCALDKLEQQFLATDGDLVELLVAITQTQPFTSEAPAPAEEKP